MFTIPNLVIALRQRMLGGGYHYRSNVNISTYFYEKDLSLTLRLKKHGGSSTLTESILYETHTAHAITQERVSICLTNWTSYLRSQPKVVASNILHVLIRSQKPENETEFLDSILSIPSEERVELLNVCSPVAWLAGDKFSVLCRCTAVELTQMCEAFMKGSLLTDEMLEIHSLTIVDVNGTPGELLNQESRRFLVSTSGSNLALLDESQDEGDVFSAPNMSSSYGSEDSKATPGACGDKTPIMHQIIPEVSSGSEASTSNLKSGGTPVRKPKQRVSGNETALTKSPNMLIYTGKRFSSAKFNELRDLLLSCVGVDNYTIYHLKHNDVITAASPWQQNCKLLVIAVERLYDGVDSRFLEYFSSGGRVLSFCSNLDDAFVRKQLNTNCNTPQVVKMIYEDISVNLTQGRSHYMDCESRLPTVTLKPLARNQRGELVLVEALSEDGGLCISTQVHCEKSVDSAGVEPSLLSPLMETDQQRQTLIIKLLEKLQVDTVTKKEVIPTITTCHIYCTRGQTHRQTFVEKVRRCHSSKVNGDVLCIPSVADFDISSEGEADLVNIGFDSQVYSENLRSNVIGNTLLFQSITKTTQALIEPFLFNAPPDCGLVAIANRQIAGVGRGDNAWLSPLGSLSMSMYIRIEMSSALGQAPALIQTLPAVAAARAISQLLPCKKTADSPYRISVKWPNDLYYGKVKIGGVIVKSTILQNCLHATVGIGVNVANQKPTVNVNDIIDGYNESEQTNIQRVSVEWMAARICSEMEILTDLINSDKTEYLNEYYKHWMHTGVRVDVPKDDVTQALIIGLDSHGFLLLQREDGELMSVQPDGNSFDIMHNLIKLKT